MNFFVLLVLVLVGLFVIFVLFTMTPLKAWGGIIFLVVIGIAAMFGYNYVKKWMGGHGL